MTLEIKVGKPRLTLHQGYTVAVAQPDGQIHAGGNGGLFFRDTRLISVWEIEANDRPWTLLNSGSLAGSAGRAYLTNPDLPSEGVIIPAQALGLVFSRHIDGGMHEDIDITNHDTKPVRFELTLTIKGDFADLFDVKANKVTKRGKTVTDWQAEAQSMTTCYRNQDFSRAFRVTAKKAGCPDGTGKRKAQLFCRNRAWRRLAHLSVP